MHGLPHRRVVHVQVVANGPHHHFPRVEPYPNAYLDAVGPAHRVGVLAHSGLHGQGGIAGPQSMILMGQGSPKQRHNAITHDLVDRALILMDGRHHALQHGVEELPSLLGSRSASSSIEVFRSAKSTMTCLRSPSSAALEVR